MATRIAIIADLHLSGRDNTVQEAALDWALQCLEAQAPDMVFLAGDLTADGTVRAARMIRDRLESAGLSFRSTPGNSDRRTWADWPAVSGLLSDATPLANDDCVAIALDSSSRIIPDEDLLALEGLIARASGRQVVVVTHMPPAYLRQGERLDAMMSSGAVDLLVAGHVHRDERYACGRAAVEIVRGLDADKAIGGPPAVVMLELDGGCWTRREIVFPGGDVVDWSGEVREQFVSLLGFSCMNHTLEGLTRAAERGTECVEIRAEPSLRDVSPADLAGSVKQWRSAGGRYLSIHAPAIGWDASKGCPSAHEMWPQTLEMARTLEAQGLTVHVPSVPVGLMNDCESARDALADTYCNLLGPMLERGTVVGIENMHMGPADRDDHARGFGYLPDECLQWVRRLRKLTRSESVGFHMDIGHARNNHPYSKLLSVGQWYAITGREISGYHLHQVSPQMVNHNPIDGVFGPMISLSSFFWGWRTGQLNHRPMFLEIRPPGTGWDCLDALRKHILPNV